VDDAILTLSDVDKRFENVTAVRGLSLSIPRGVIYGMIGPNGAGKTTTIRMILNIIAPDKGTIKCNFRRTGAAANDLIGYLPEERGLYRRSKVEDVLIFMAEIKSVPPRESRLRIARWLERLDLQEWRTRKVQELSKGMQQKVQFISTVLHEPELLILDEPFSGLDPINTELIKDIILELRSAGTTILFSTHVMEQAEKLCDHLCMIDHGQEVLDGSLAHIKARFGEDVLVVSGEIDPQILRGLPGVRAVRSERRRHELMLDPGTDHRPLLSQILAKGSIDGFQRSEPSLHSIFLKMAGSRDRPDPAEASS
jgi:ABC-2 type transport system ATP-binding protein